MKSAAEAAQNGLNVENILKIKKKKSAEISKIFAYMLLGHEWEKNA